jgi:toxin-antitoxin system PIN domain toxin
LRALFDVNVLLALFDQAHIHHLLARNWLKANVGQGWASCPLTQNGFLRVISQPRYPKPITTQSALDLLDAATSTRHHEFWPDDLSFLEHARFERSRIHGPSQLTDLYLLSLAVARGGRLVTFDADIQQGAVRGAGSQNLVVL